MLYIHVIYIIKSGPKKVARKHNWAEKDWAENKSGLKRDLPIIIVKGQHNSIKYKQDNPLVNDPAHAQQKYSSVKK